MKNEINIMSNQIESVWYLISGGCFFLLSKMSVIITNFEKV